jgi:hypothetical protein
MTSVMAMIRVAREGAGVEEVVMRTGGWETFGKDYTGGGERVAE